MFADLPGQQLLIYNDTKNMIKDLCFLMPGSDIEYKCKKLPATLSNKEHIYEGYAGDLIFYFKSNPEKTYVFPKLVNGKNRGNTNEYTLTFHIKEENGNILIERTPTTRENNRDRVIVE